MFGAASTNFTVRSTSPALTGGWVGVGSPSIISKLTRHQIIALLEAKQELFLGELQLSSFHSLPRKDSGSPYSTSK